VRLSTTSLICISASGSARPRPTSTRSSCFRRGVPPTLRRPPRRRPHPLLHRRPRHPLPRSNPLRLPLPPSHHVRRAGRNRPFRRSVPAPPMSPQTERNENRARASSWSRRAPSRRGRDVGPPAPSGAMPRRLGPGRSARLPSLPLTLRPARRRAEQDPEQSGRHPVRPNVVSSAHPRPPIPRFAVRARRSSDIPRVRSTARDAEKPWSTLQDGAIASRCRSRWHCW
jgi:hypothetical protein